MEIIEHFLLGKHKDPSKCEDIIFMNDHYAAIIDGATAKGEHTFNGNSTGKTAALLVEEALHSMNEKSTKEEAAQHITQHIYNFYEKENYLSKIKEDPKHKCTASVIIYSFHHSEIWQFGDCQCLIDNEYFEANKLIDHITESSRSIVIGSLLHKGHTIEELLQNDLSRTAIEPLLLNQQSYQNIPLKESVYGYVCFDGFDIPIEDVPTVKVPATAQHIVLASDGYPKLFNTLKASEEHLQYIKDVDPLCYHIFPSTKGFNFDLNSYDDRSYLSLKRKA